jgi:hypothetical protein
MGEDAMADKSVPTLPQDEPSKESSQIQAGDAQLESDSMQIGGDVTGRDHIQSAGGHIIRAEAGSTVIIKEDWPGSMPQAASSVPEQAKARNVHYPTRRAVMAILGSALLGTLGLWAISRILNPPRELPFISQPPQPPVALLLPFVDCPADLTDQSYLALTHLLSTESITASVQRGATPAHDVNSARASRPATLAQALIIWGQCSGDQITYHVEIFIPPDELAEPESVNFTWTQDSLEVPTHILSSIVAYYHGAIDQAAAWLRADQPHWEQLPPAEQAAMQFLLGNAWLRHREQPVDEVLGLYPEVLANSVKAGEVAPAWLSKVHNNWGLALIIKGLTLDAERELDLALQADPRNVWAMMNRSLARASRNQIEPALEDCRQAYLLSGQSALGDGCRAQVFYWQVPSEAPQTLLEAAQSALKATPPYVTAYYYAGVASCRLGDTDAARRWFEEFIKLSRNPILIPPAISFYITPLKAGDPCSADPEQPQAGP